MHQVNLVLCSSVFRSLFVRKGLPVIQKLITRIIETLSSRETGLGADFPTTGSIIAGPLPPEQEPEQVPAIVIAMGQLEINQRYKDSAAGQSRPPEANAELRVREFQQQLWVDIYATTMAESERWAALVSSVILTQPAALLQGDSKPDVPDYQAGAVRSYHQLNDITLLAGTPHRSAGRFRLQLAFQVAGTLHLSRTRTRQPALIETIHLPDPDSLPNPD